MLICPVAAMSADNFFISSITSRRAIISISAFGDAARIDDYALGFYGFIQKRLLNGIEMNIAIRQHNAVCDKKRLSTVKLSNCYYFLSIMAAQKKNDIKQHNPDSIKAKGN